MSAKITKITANKNCRNCMGRGFVLIMRPDLSATDFREIRPCTCMKAVIDYNPKNPIPKVKFITEESK